MPVIVIALSGRQLPLLQQQDLQRMTTRLIEEIMGKRRSVTAVMVQSLPSANWAIGGEALNDHLRAAQVDITITAGTNTAEEKAGMIDAVHQMLNDRVGPLAEASYVVIHEVAADAWGYAGLTQQSRQQMRQLI
ncbi:MAG: tautomerase family protein [Candidatus Thiodiazotropha sp. (ex. Lucinisca nassula)]|uniref:tautomerase family protein n=1 Tax=Candidatus Thiodiazotropha sp. LNASS1 TaxID=3096260 RepID=UPI000D36727E|nr:tautomerase family protein [Candidatus Thiodiazotropha sp. (ex. Lucinisca nassula)]MBW9273302.1 tautomerase family protein [Candidatus Thiodiazotropha sp. (ex. Lucinisca nassula)]PUB85082.1 MAG: 4-oxalocrotonate tautomerase [gamma proteobacterium symbiont of Ctena orbiculata]PUB89124.1 MAG: 4-oxalocrotonate tautomerase [gamma proteobacterium symbiont of Ctena orbiculata]